MIPEGMRITRRSEDLVREHVRVQGGWRLLTFSGGSTHTNTSSATVFLPVTIGPSTAIQPPWALHSTTPGPSTPRSPYTGGVPWPRGVRPRLAALTLVVFPDHAGSIHSSQPLHWWCSQTTQGPSTPLSPYTGGVPWPRGVHPRLAALTLVVVFTWDVSCSHLSMTSSFLPFQTQLKIATPQKHRLAPS